MTALICGSLAFDTIMLFKDKFKHHILPEQVHILNVSFMVPEMRREFGGCAGNIAYNLKLLGGNPLPMGTVGNDFTPYANWLDRCGIARTHITEIAHTYTAQAFITTDLDDNQITAFHPGAMNFAHHNQVSQAQPITLGIVSPDGREGMIQHAQQFADHHIPFIFDPGQGLPLFNGAELTHFIQQATWVIVNDYEWQLMAEKTKLSPAQITEQVQALIITKGAEGATIYTPHTIHLIPPAKPRVTRDPTGCGDAFRGGLLYGLLNQLNWEITGRIAALMGTLKIEHHGTQNHHFTLAEFNQRFQENYSLPFEISTD